MSGLTFSVQIFVFLGHRLIFLSLSRLLARNVVFPAGTPNFMIFSSKLSIFSEIPFIYQDDSIGIVRQRLESSSSQSKESTPSGGDEKPDENFLEDALQWLETQKSPLIETLEADLSKLQRERVVRRFVGDHFSADLLSIVIDRFAPPLSSVDHLPPNLQMFWDTVSFKERETRVITVACAADQAMERRLVEQAVVVGGAAKERVTDRLIVSADLRYASIKAALLVSCQDNEKAKSLIKLIATNLIASDLIEDGVELLFLVGAGGDACKYLQSQKLWTKSIVYAKVSTPSCTPSGQV